MGSALSLDVVILAGGLGTRLRGVWDGPKCLVPVAGRPLLERMLEAVARFSVRRPLLVLGHKHREVMEWLAENKVPAEYIVESLPEGTAGALQYAAGHLHLCSALPDSLLVLNGDTLPRYELEMLIDNHAQHLHCLATAAMTRVSANWKATYAGACVLSAAAIEEILADKRSVDLEKHLLGCQPYYVPDFFDVGTPEGLARANEHFKKEMAT